MLNLITVKILDVLDILTVINMAIWALTGTPLSAEDCVLNRRSYLDSLAEEINDRLQQQGLVTIAELTKGYDLPGDFISQVFQSHLILCDL